MQKYRPRSDVAERVVGSGSTLWPFNQHVSTFYFIPLTFPCMYVTFIARAVYMYYGAFWFFYQVSPKVTKRSYGICEEIDPEPVLSEGFIRLFLDKF